MLLHLLLVIVTFGKWGWRRLTQLGTIQPSHIRSSAYVAQQLSTVEPCPVISSMFMWIHRYVTFCNALFSRMQRISQKCKQNFRGELSTIATLMFAVLNMMLNSSALIYMTTSTHPCEYIDVQPFALHHFRGGRASLNWLCINFGGELSTIATLMFIVLHVLLNSFTLLNLVQLYHLHAR